MTIAAPTPKYRLWVRGIELWMSDGQHDDGRTRAKEFDTEQQARDYVERLCEGYNADIPGLVTPKPMSLEQFSRGYVVVPYEGQQTTDRMRPTYGDGGGK